MRAATIMDFRSGLDLKFQSTQPMRAATIDGAVTLIIVYISIHAAHAGCDISTSDHYSEGRISIHAAHAGCDHGSSSAHTQHTISIHAAHAGCDTLQCMKRTRQEISIHAAHAGCDGD